MDGAGAKITAGLSVGVDAGATLTKLAVREAGGGLAFGFLPAGAAEAVARRIRALAPTSLGLTGCGAAELAPRLAGSPRRFVEFAAWGTGASHLLAKSGEHRDGEPYLLVSVGTGTSVLRVEAGQAQRLGGTALGGGTLLGLGVALTGCASFRELCELAARGRRGNIDLLVSDIYPPGEIALPGETTAACFGNLARWLAPQSREEGPRDRAEPSRREDLAAAVVGLVGENVALICSGLAASSGVSHVVYGGATLSDNPSLVAILLGVTAALGHRPTLLRDGGHAGALGALLLAEPSSRA